MKKIRIRKKDIKLFNELKKKAKNRSRYLKKTYDVDVVVPNIKLENIQTRDEFNSVIEIYKDITDKKNYRYKKVGFWDMVIPYKTYLHVENLHKITEYRRKKYARKYKKLKIYDSDDDVDLTDEEYQKIFLGSKSRFAFYEPRPRPDWSQINYPSDLDNLIEFYERRANPQYFRQNDEQMKVNYINALYNVYGEQSQYLIDIIDELSNDDFTSIILSTPNLDFEHIYQSSVIFGRFGTQSEIDTDFVEKIEIWNRQIQRFRNA